MPLVQRYQIFFIALIVSLSSPAFAVDVPRGVSVVTAPEVRSMMARGDVLLIHTLSRIEFQMQHIPGSINIPVDEIATSARMPSAKSAAIIFYCNGRACPYSKRAAKSAVKHGYTNVYWYRGGILEWRKFQYPMYVNQELRQIKVAKLSPARFLQKREGNVLVLDVRPQWWRQSKEQAGVIEGTEMMIPLLKLDKELKRLSKKRPILIVDRLMRQSTHAAKYLMQHGYQVVGVLKGGSKRWVKEGRPILRQQDEPTMHRGS